MRWGAEGPVRTGTPALITSGRGGTVVTIGATGATITETTRNKGFLGTAVSGPFEGFYQSLAGAAWADWLFMTGLLAVTAAGDALGLGKLWAELPLVQRLPWLK